MVLCLGLAGTQIKKYWGEYVAILFIFFVNGIPCLLEYVIQIRMYSWTLFWVTWAGVSAYGVYKEQGKSNQIQLIIATLCACYTHNYAMISCVCIYLVLALVMLKSPKQWMISGSLISICYVPWLVVLYHQTAERVGNYWIKPVTRQEIPEDFKFLFASDIPYSEWMIVFLFGLGIYQSIKDIMENKESGAVALYILSIPIVTAIIGVVVSVLVTPFFIARYLIPCVGLLALFLAISFGRGRMDMKILLVIFSCIIFISAYRINYE